MLENNLVTNPEILRKRRSIESEYQISRSTIYRWVSEGKFPKPISFGDGCGVRWRQSDLDAWQQSLTSKA